MRVLFALALSSALATSALAQDAPTKLTIAMRVVFDESVRKDSAAIMSAIRTTIEADTAFQFVDRTPVPGQTLTGIRIVLTVTFAQGGGRLLTSLRVFDAKAGRGPAPESIATPAGALVTSLPPVVRKLLATFKPGS